MTVTCRRARPPGFVRRLLFRALCLACALVLLLEGYPASPFAALPFALLAASVFRDAFVVRVEVSLPVLDESEIGIVRALFVAASPRRRRLQDFVERLNLAVADHNAPSPDPTATDRLENQPPLRPEGRVREGGDLVALEGPAEVPPDLAPRDLSPRDLLRGVLADGDPEDYEGALFPMDDRALIIDEAHRLPEALSSAYGAHLTLGKALHLSRSARRGDPARASRYADALDWAAERFFRELANVAPGAIEDEDALPDPEALTGALLSLRNVLQGSPAGQARAVAGMAKQLLRDLRSFYKGRDTHARAVLEREGGRAHELRSWLVVVGPAFAWDVVARSTGADTGEADAEEPGRGPVTVLCSATLATGSGPKRSFAHARRALGVNLLLKTRPGTRYEEHRTEEAFDYANRALLYLERRLPEPTRRNAEEYARLCALRTAELLEASRGGALVLLSTARAVGLFREYLDVPYPVRYKTDGAPTGPLVEWPKSTPGAVLVGTRSLWEGVDIVRPQVSLVVIDKVPFAAPNYPVNKALTERAGADWFRLVSLPAAHVALRQGAGRLIRSASDRGVLALLDPRVSARSWGRQVVSSLPPAPATDSLERVRRFLAD